MIPREWESWINTIHSIDDLVRGQVTAWSMAGSQAHLRIPVKSKSPSEDVQAPELGIAYSAKTELMARAPKGAPP